MTTVLLQDGTRVSNSEELIRRYCNGDVGGRRRDSSYINYDCCSVEPDSLTEPDIRVANKMQARIAEPTCREILRNRAQIESILRSIPRQSDLTAEDVPWQRLIDLFRIFTDIPRVKLARTTKILHKKRPQLIPILDSVVQDYAQDRLKTTKRKIEELATAYCKVIQGDLRNNHDALLTIRRELKASGIDLTAVRIIDILIWTKRKDR